MLHPAGHAGVVGLKPTVGLTSRGGVIPGSHNRDSVGTFARNVHDAALLLDAIYGPDDADPWSLAQVGKTPDGGYAQYATNSSALKGAVFGIPYHIWWSTIAGLRAPGNEAKFLARLEQLKQAGATIVNMTAPLPYSDDIQNAYGWGDAVGTPYWLQSQLYLNVDLYNGYTEWLQNLTWPNGTAGGLPLNNLGDLVVWNNQNNATTGALGGAYPWKSGQDALIAGVATAGVRDTHYWTAWCKFPIAVAVLHSLLTLPRLAPSKEPSMHQRRLRLQIRQRHSHQDRRRPDPEPWWRWCFVLHCQCTRRRTIPSHHNPHQR